MARGIYTCDILQKFIKIYGIKNKKCSKESIVEKRQRTFGKRYRSRVVKKEIENIKLKLEIEQLKNGKKDKKK
ncbi:MAG: hypothetical protein LE178_04275, partial [Endomicrobium sp.]|nr:hypothetical protein [Endomicrobium sp.]